LERQLFSTTWKDEEFRPVHGRCETWRLEVRKKQILLVVIPLMSWLFLWAAKSAPLEGSNPRKCVFFWKTPSDYRAVLVAVPFR